MSIEPGTKRGPYSATRVRRERISAAVLSLVDEGGLDVVTIAGVAERSDTSERTVLYHFPSKDHLLVAALEHADDRAAAAAERDDAQPRPSAGAAVEFDLNAVRALASSLQTNDHRLRLFLVLKGYSASPSHPAHDYFRRRTARLIDLYSALIEHGQKVGHAHPGLDPRTTAIQVAALWDGLTGLTIYEADIDAGDLLVEGFRRLTGANWMDVLASLSRSSVGL